MQRGLALQGRVLGGGEGGQVGVLASEQRLVGSAPLLEQLHPAARMAAQACFGGGHKLQQALARHGIARMVLPGEPEPPPLRGL